MFAMDLDLSVVLCTAAAVAAACWFFIRARHRQEAARVQADWRAEQNLALALGPQIREAIAQRQLREVIAQRQL